MKIDRLLSIIIHLLNNDTVTSAKLAQRFDVSTKTILRDMEHLSLAGIPIKSLPGANGGYSIMEGYKLNGGILNKKEQASILTALKGCISAYGNEQYHEVLEKVSAILPKQQRPQHIFLDFGASGESSELQDKLKRIEKTIVNKHAASISYVNAMGHTSCRLIEPLALNYRWYAWYLLAFCRVKQDYRIFKVVRISDFVPTKTIFSKEHDNPAVLLDQTFKNDNLKNLDITLQCKDCIRVQAIEYLGGTITETLKNGDFIMQLSVIESERMWFAMLLSFGNMIKVLEPAELKIRSTEAAKNILSVYKE